MHFIFRFYFFIFVMTLNKIIKIMTDCMFCRNGMGLLCSCNSKSSKRSRVSSPRKHITKTKSKNKNNIKCSNEKVHKKKSK
jgi:hypothetical protein